MRTKNKMTTDSAILNQTYEFISVGPGRMECNKKKMFLTIIWIIGLMFTGHNLIENYKLYKTYPTLQMAKFDADSKWL